MKQSILITTMALALLAAPAQAGSVAALDGSIADDELILIWQMIGSADSLRLHWITEGEAQGSMVLDPTLTELALAAPEQSTTFVLLMESNGTVTLSNPFSGDDGPCSPESWVILYTSPPNYGISWDCLPG